MPKNYITNLALILILILIAFFTGFFYARREIVATNKSPILSIATEQGNTYNVFTNLKRKEIFGVFTGSKQNYGELQYIVNPNNDHTDILISLNNIPNIIEVDQKKINVPTKFKVLMASTCCNGLDYLLKDENLIVETASVGETSEIKYTTTLKYNIENSNIERLLFAPMDTKTENTFKIIKDETKDWPKNLLEKPAPYFWINIS